MRLRLLILLAGTRLRLAPRWLRVQPQRRPVHTMIMAVLAPAVLTAVLVVLLPPGPARACQHVPSKIPGRVHLICTDAALGPR